MRAVCRLHPPLLLFPTATSRAPRYKCGVCEDIDLCGPCMRALVAARIKMAAEAGEVAAAAAPRRPPPGGRPRRWVSKLHSRDLAAKWAALQTAVPCLHPSHKFQRVVDGPERAVVYVAGSADGSADQLQPLQPQQATAADAADAAAEALAVASLGNGAAATSASSGGEPAAAAASSSSSSSGLDQFLATFPPSASSCADVAWICVEAQQQAAPASSSSGAGCAAAAAGSSSSGGGGAAAAGPSLEERVDAAVEEWERLTAAAARAKRRVTAADVDRLAAKHRILKGKWLCFARSPEEADGAWPAVARAVCGRPGGRPLCASAKCSSTAPDGSHVICAYVASYQVWGLCCVRRVSSARRRLQARQRGAAALCLPAATAHVLPPPLLPGAGRGRRAARVLRAAAGGAAGAAPGPAPAVQGKAGQHQRARGGGWARAQGLLPFACEPALPPTPPAGRHCLVAALQRWLSPCLVLAHAAP